MDSIRQVDADIISSITGQTEFRTNPSFLTGCLTTEPQLEFVTATETAVDVQVGRRKFNVPLVQAHCQPKCESVCE